MKPILIRHLLLIIITFISLIAATLNVYPGQGSLLEHIKKADTPLKKERNEDEDIDPISKQTVLVKTDYQGGSFWTETRKENMGRYPCRACHNNQTPPAAQPKELAHNDIKLDHGGQDKPLSCLICHSRDNRDMLVRSDEVIDMDHSYEMCGQCHFRQREDWAGGAHGKRISYWDGKRVVKNCVSCHDPHSPRFEKRWPKTYSPPLQK